MQQLDLFGKAIKDLDQLRADLVAVGSDDLAAARALKDNPDKIVFPMPLLPDPRLELFKRFDAHDDFEGQPLHALYIIDSNGQVRYRRISAEPLLDVDFVKSELARANLMAPPASPK
jgi:alkyl hydroperoxide reductase subunit AhpC